MAKEDNLTSFGDMPPEKLKKITRMGGIASGRARRKKADFKKSIETLLALSVPRGKLYDALVENGIEPSYENAMLFSSLQAAIKRGDIYAVMRFREITGQDKTLADRQEQRARIEKIKADTASINAELNPADDEALDDGFLEALRGKVEEVWQEDD